MPIWKKLFNIVTIQNKWLTIKCDKYRVGCNELEYWTVQRSSSLIIITIQNGNFILLKNNFRPGLNTKTLDFPGGRLESHDLLKSAQDILKRELLVKKNDYTIEILSDKGFASDSSFSSQKVYYCIATLKNHIQLSGSIDFQQYSGNTEISNLLDNLDCLQCRMGLFEYLLSSSKSFFRTKNSWVFKSEDYFSDS